jgi:predicted transcriptional regulator
MTTAISIPDDLFEKAEEVAERLKVSRSQLYARAIAMGFCLSRAAPRAISTPEF